MGEKGQNPPECPPPPPCCTPPPPCCPPPLYCIPPACQFQVKGLKQLEELERALAKKNLKDPWIRNEAWRYHPDFGTRATRARQVFFRGLPLGAVLAAIATAATALMGLAEGGHH